MVRKYEVSPAVKAERERERMLRVLRLLEKNSQPLSRQRLWQIKKQLEGACVICGKPRGKNGSADRCAKHHKADVARLRQSYKRAGGTE